MVRLKHKNSFAFILRKEIGCGGDWIHVAQYRLAAAGCCG
jgi:hypothetical protein